MDLLEKLSGNLLNHGESEALTPLGSLKEIALLLLEKVEKQETGSFQRFFNCVEQELIFGDRALQDTIIVELLEALKNEASMRDLDYAIFESWLGPETHLAWRWLEKKWQGKMSLGDSASGL